MWGFVNSNYRCYCRGVQRTVWCLRVTHSGRQVWGCCCPRRPSVPREDTVAQPRGVTLHEGGHRNALALPRCLRRGWWQIWSQEDVCLWFRAGKLLDLRSERCRNPSGCCQVPPPISGLGFTIPTFVLEDPLSCKSKQHFYYYFQLLHDSYYSSALTSAINNNRIVNYCSF